MFWNVFIFRKYCQVLFLHTLVSLLVVQLLLQDFICIDDYDCNVVRCRPKCNYGKFSLYGMTFCYSWLSCSDIDEIQMAEEISHGAVKQV